MFNKITAIGNLTRDIEFKICANGTALAKSAIATSHSYKTASGERKEEVCFIDFNVFGRLAEIANTYLRKGSKVLFDGRLVFEQWTAQDGTNRSKHTFRVDTLKLLDSKNSNPSESINNQPTYIQPSNIDKPHIIKDIDFDVNDCPF
jgi:single-strand DNA-binding protein